MTTAEWLNRGRVLDKEIVRLQNKYIDVLIELVSAISKLPDREERIILYEYYCSGQTWETVAEHLSVSYNQVFRIKRDAIQHLQGLLRDDQMRNKADVITE